MERVAEIAWVFFYILAEDVVKFAGGCVLLVVLIISYPIRLGITMIKHKQKPEFCPLDCDQGKAQWREVKLEKGREGLPASLYNREYYLGEMSGWELFRSSNGRELCDRLKRFLDRVAPCSGDRILEIGCGRGELSAALAHLCRRVVGIDYSQAAIEICRETFGSYWANLYFRVADATELPFGDNEFDVVVCTEILEHLTPAQNKEMINEVARVLKKDGRFIAQTEPNRFYGYFSAAWLVSLPYKIMGRRIQGRINKQTGRKRRIVNLHINEHTYWSLKRLVKGFFKSYQIDVVELVRGGENKWGRFVFNAYPFNNLPLVRWFINREIVVKCQYPVKGGKP